MLKIRKIKDKISLYDINVKDNHNFYANDILVHNCVESFSPSSPSKDFTTYYDKEHNTTHQTFTPGRTHTCNLASLNLSKMNHKAINKYTKLAVRMLDKAIDLTKVPIIEGELLSQETRIIGIGIMGLADYLAFEKKSYERDFDYIESLFERVSFYALEASVEIAEEKGAFELFDISGFKDKMYLGKNGNELMEQSVTKEFNWNELLEKAQHGVRNSQLLAIAPNTSTSLVCGCSASYLPIFSKFSYETLDKMNVPVVPMYIKDRFWYYKEYVNILAKDIINLTNKVSKWIDTGISMELVLSEKDSIKDISDALLDGFSENLKALYYSRTISKSSVNGTRDTCVSCAN